MSLSTSSRVRQRRAVAGGVVVVAVHALAFGYFALFGCALFCWSGPLADQEGLSLTIEYAGRTADGPLDVRQLLVWTNGPACNGVSNLQVSVNGGPFEPALEPNFVAVDLDSLEGESLELALTDGVTTWTASMPDLLEERTLSPTGGVWSAAAGDELEVTFSHPRTLRAVGSAQLFQDEQSGGPTLFVQVPSFDGAPLNTFSLTIAPDAPDAAPGEWMFRARLDHDAELLCVGPVRCELWATTIFQTPFTLLPSASANLDGGPSPDGG